MKRSNKYIIMFLMICIVSILTVTQAAAADAGMTAEERMAELKLLDEGPDFSKGALVSELWGKEDDGTPYVERTYVIDDACAVSARSINGMRRFYKTRNYGATGYVEVYATFAWDTAARKTYVSNVTGNYYNGGGVSQVENPISTYGGDATSNAWAQYSIRVNRNLGGWTTYSVVMNCNYNGSCDGIGI